MTPSLTPGKKPSVSDRLTAYLDTEASAYGKGDEIDALIEQEGLTISRFAFYRDLDLMLIVLNNRRIISRFLSAYPFLSNATDQQLTEYSVSSSGIHWTAIDADLSLRGFLIEETVKNFRMGVADPAV